MSVVVKTVDNVLGAPSADGPRLSFQVGRITAREIVRARVRMEVERYNNEHQGGFIISLFVPASEEAELNGPARVRRRVLDADHQVEVALEAVRNGRRHPVQRRAGHRSRCRARRHAVQRSALPETGPVGRRLSMADELEEIRASLAVSLRQPGASLTDPQIAPLLARMQALLRQRVAQTGGAVVVQHPRAAPPNVAHEPAPIAAIDLAPQLRQLAEDYIRHTRGQRPMPGMWFVQAPALSECDAGRRLLELDPADKARLVVATYAAWTNERFGGPDGAGLRRIVSDLLRARLDFDEAQALLLIKAAVREGFGHSSYSPNLAIAGALKRYVETHGLAPSVRDALSGLRARMVHGHSRGNSEGRKLLLIVDAMLAQVAEAPAGEARFKPKPDAWGSAIAEKLIALQPDRRARLTRLLALAAQGGATARPAKGWLKTAEKELATPTREDDGALLLDCIECHEPGGTLALENQNTLRALLWLAAIAAPAAAARRIEAYAQTCLTFSSAHFAYLSLVLGNAAIHAFSLMPGTAGVGSLSRLKRRMKRPGEIKTIDKALTALAQSRGMSAGELEEIGLPDFGFAADGTLAIAVGPATVQLAITDGNDLKTAWRDADGRALGGPPAAVKQTHADTLKAFKARAKEIDETLRAQRLRVERLYLGDREWPLDLWQSRYLAAPLIRNLARRLVWSFRIGDRWIAGLPGEDGLCDVSGARISVDHATRVRLWHPMQADAPTVLAWRRRLAQMCVTQPFKQAHREIYVLTDAERQTRDHSNRFAHHIVDQHLFRACARRVAGTAPLSAAGIRATQRCTSGLPNAICRWSSSSSRSSPRWAGISASSTWRPARCASPRPRDARSPSRRSIPCCSPS